MREKYSARVGSQARKICSAFKEVILLETKRELNICKSHS
jgi:hypothetical protein